MQITKFLDQLTRPVDSSQAHDLQRIGEGYVYDLCGIPEDCDYNRLKPLVVQLIRERGLDASVGILDVDSADLCLEEHPHPSFYPAYDWDWDERSERRRRANQLNESQF